jgi:hypothetical protein
MMVRQISGCGGIIQCNYQDLQPAFFHQPWQIVTEVIRGSQFSQSHLDRGFPCTHHADEAVCRRFAKTLFPLAPFAFSAEIPGRKRLQAGMAGRTLYPSL